MKTGETVRALLQFDEHWDNPHSDQDMIRRHMQEAVDEGAPIIKGGDTFCAMQGRYDPRRARRGIRPEHDHPDYVDRLVSGYSEFAQFAAPNIAFMGRGNHELGIKNIETDLIERTAERQDCRVSRSYGRHWRMDYLGVPHIKDGQDKHSGILSSWSRWGRACN